MTPGEHATACDIAAKLYAFFSTISAEIRNEVLLDWHESRHWRTRPGRCGHCHSPAMTNLVDDDGRYSHKTCAEISAYLAGPAADDAVIADEADRENGETPC